MSDAKWLLMHGFERVDKLSTEFSLFATKFGIDGIVPSFRDCVISGEFNEKTDRPFTIQTLCLFIGCCINSGLCILVQ